MGTPFDFDAGDDALNGNLRGGGFEDALLAPLRERIVAVACPRARAIDIHLADGVVRIDEAEAIAPHGALGGALAILRGDHPAQAESRS